ncbi:efflux RND transporter periplasmic adaptor subunit [Thalassotalea ganghwensis]
MDIVKQKNSTGISPKLKKWLALTLLFILVIVYASYQTSLVKLAKKDLLISTVKQGDLDIVIQGYGKFVSSKVVAITTNSRATVSEILLKPGAAISKGQVFLKLSNPELNQQLENAQQELNLAEANLRQLKLTQKRELLNEQALLAQIVAAYEAAVLKRKAEAQLVEQGIVSQITFQESQLNERQLHKRIALLKERLTQLSLVHIEAERIEKEKINQKLGWLAVAQNRVDALDVKSSIDGVLQRLPVSLGQSLTAGEELAIVGSTNSLIALVRVSQSQAQQLRLGQVAYVDSRQGVINGHVERIDPIVSDNTVEVEIIFSRSLPDSARPEQNINAEILVSTLKDIKYIERPSNFKVSETNALYRLTKQRDRAQRVSVTFGESNGRLVTVNSGLMVGDEVIISDLSNYQVEEISLN